MPMMLILGGLTKPEAGVVYCVYSVRFELYHSPNVEKLNRLVIVFFQKEQTVAAFR